MSETMCIDGIERTFSFGVYLGKKVLYCDLCDEIVTEDLTADVMAWATFCHVCQEEDCDG
jgi:hypothetical protein